MPKDTFWFKHDYDPTGDPKIAALLYDFGAFGYGIYWRIIEMLHIDSRNMLPLKKYIFIAIAKQMEANTKQKIANLPSIENLPEIVESVIKQCIDEYELLSCDGQFFWCERVNRNIGEKNKLSVTRSKSGSKGGRSKANAKQDEANAKQNVAEERRGEENIDTDNTTSSYTNNLSLYTLMRNLACARFKKTTVELLSEPEKISLMLIPEMFKVWMDAKPKYPHDTERDYPALLEIAYYIANQKNWKKDEVVKEKKDKCLGSWKKIAEFIVSSKADKFIKSLSLEGVFKNLQRIQCAMQVEKDHDPKVKQLASEKNRIKHEDYFTDQPQIVNPLKQQPK